MIEIWKIKGQSVILKSMKNTWWVSLQFWVFEIASANQTKTCGIILSFPFFFSFSLSLFKPPIKAFIFKFLPSLSPATCCSPSCHRHHILLLLLHFLFLLLSFMASIICPSSATHDQHESDLRATHAVKVDSQWPQPLTHRRWAVVATKLFKCCLDFSAISSYPFTISGRRGHFWDPYSITFLVAPILLGERHRKICTFFHATTSSRPFFWRMMHFRHELILNWLSSFCSLWFEVWHAYVWRIFENHVLRDRIVNLNFVSICMQN